MVGIVAQDYVSQYKTLGATFAWWKSSKFSPFFVQKCLSKANSSGSQGKEKGQFHKSETRRAKTPGFSDTTNGH